MFIQLDRQLPTLSISNKYSTKNVHTNTNTNTNMKTFKQYCNEDTKKGKATYITVPGENSAEVYGWMIDDIKDLGVKVKHVSEVDILTYGGKTQKVCLGTSVDMVNDLVDALIKFGFSAHEVDAFTWVISKEKISAEQAQELFY